MNDLGAGHRERRGVGFAGLLVTALVCGAGYCGGRVAFRMSREPTKSFSDLGFRVVCVQ
jgi:hypothetical protein